MQAMMKQLGLQQEEIPADRVIIEKPDGKIVIENPSVSRISIQGQETFQISGDVSDEPAGIRGFSEEDVKTVMEKTGCSKLEAEAALEKSGDLAEAILELSD